MKLFEIDEVNILFMYFVFCGNVERVIYGVCNLFLNLMIIVIVNILFCKNVCIGLVCFYFGDLGYC